MTTLCRMPHFLLLVPVGSFVCCVSCFVCRCCGCGNCCLFVVSPCLYPCRFACTLFSVPRMGVGVWGGCGFAWFAGGFSGVVLLPCGCVYPSVCALLLGRVCLGWEWCVCGRVRVRLVMTCSDMPHTSLSGVGHTLW